MATREPKVAGITILALALAMLSTPLAGQAPPRNHLYDKFQVGGSLSSVILNSNVRVDGSNEDVGGEVDAEEDLGLSKVKLQPRFAMRWRPGKRHELEVGYQFARRTGEKVLQRSFEYGDTSFTAGLRVRSRFDTDQAFLNYRFAFMARENTQVGIGLGLGALFFGTGIDALAGVTGGGKADSVAYSSSSDLIGPTASLGLYGRFRVGDAWYLEGDLRGVKVAIDRYDASIVEGGFGARYFLSPKWGIDAGYGLSSITVEIAAKEDSKAGAAGKITYSLQHFRLGMVFTP